MHIVGRTSPVTAVKRILFLIKLSQRSLNKGGSGTQKGCDPHPEYGSGSACGNRSHNAYQISHSYTGGSGNYQRLTGRKRGCFSILPLQSNPQHILK